MLFPYFFTDFGEIRHRRFPFRSCGFIKIGRDSHMGNDSGVHRVLVGKPEGKRPLGSSRRRWEDNIKMDLQEVGGGRGDWME
jgi:hypothetical protein